MSHALLLSCLIPLCCRPLAAPLSRRQDNRSQILSAARKSSSDAMPQYQQNTANALDFEDILAAPTEFYRLRPSGVAPNLRMDN